MATVPMRWPIWPRRLPFTWRIEPYSARTYIADHLSSRLLSAWHACNIHESTVLWFLKNLIDRPVQFDVYTCATLLPKTTKRRKIGWSHTTQSSCTCQNNTQATPTSHQLTLKLVALDKKLWQKWAPGNNCKVRCAGADPYITKRCSTASLLWSSTSGNVEHNVSDGQNTGRHRWSNFKKGTIIHQHSEKSRLPIMNWTSRQQEAVLNRQQELWSAWSRHHQGSPVRMQKAEQHLSTA